MQKGEKNDRELHVNHPNFSVANGIVKSGKRYVYSEAGRRYEVLCLDVWEERGLICLQLQVLKSDPKVYSLPAGEIIDVSINVEGIGFQGMWFLRDA